MEQKVNHLGLRVGITKKHQSQWFARFNKYAYSQSIVEDHMLRKTLISLWPDLLNPVLKASTSSQKAQKKEANTKAGLDTTLTPKITHIQIERGLIPYEIGIQIHAENCEVIKAAVDNLKVNRELLNNLQKTRQYLSRVVSPISNYSTDLGPVQMSEVKYKSAQSKGLDLSPLSTNITSLEPKTKANKKRTIQKALSQKKQRRTLRTAVTTLTKKNSQFDAKKRSGRFKRLPKKVFLKITNLKKRLKKRQLIRNRYLQIISKGLLLRKNGKQILRKVKVVSKNQYNKNTKKTNSNLRNNRLTQKTKSDSYSKNAVRTKKHNLGLQKTQSNTALKGLTKAFQLSKPINKTKNFLKLGTKLSNKLAKKMANLYINKVNQKFLIRLKALMKYWHLQSQNLLRAEPLNTKASTIAPLSYNAKSKFGKLLTSSKGNSTNLQVVSRKLMPFASSSTNLSWQKYANMPITKLTKLIDVLEKKSLQKMEILRKDFIGFGTISKTRSFGYYQIITLLKQFKELVNKLKKINKATLFADKSQKSKSINAKSKVANFFLKVNSQKSLTQNVFNAVVNKLDTVERRKIQFINYLQNIVKKHRNENLFYYLSSMAVASKDYKELKRYTLKHSSFLFGLDSNSLANINKQTIQAKIEKVLAQSNRKYDFDKNLQDAFLEQVENQRNMYKANLALTPKISIKFFSVKKDNILEKASVVADSVVDALEKRKAFRGVIKKAKEDLMRRSRVKGVKIQVSGRLNGAEIARSEWVRAGRVPLQTLRANIDYSYRTASTIYGIIGVKVWIFKGYN